MANLILTGEGWEKRIRSKMGVDEAYLPDGDLQQPDIICIAESNIVEQIPSHETLKGVDRVYLEAATVLECCTLVCPSMSARLPVQEVSPHLEVKLNIDWGKKKAYFGKERDSLIRRILKLSDIPHFGLTR